MRHASLFSGIGGFDLAATWAGWENVFNCEIDPFPRKILNYYWPNAIQYADIKATDFTIHRGRIDILTGGFPCQPYSHAGKRLGKEDERHLWPEMLRAIREIQPRWVVGENVRGLTNWNGGLVFNEVQAELEAAGYEVFPFLLPACGVDAPHRRERIWFVAHANSYGLCRNNESKKSFKPRNGRQTRCQINPPLGSWLTSNTSSEQCPKWGHVNRERTDAAQNYPRVDNRTPRFSPDGDAANANGKGLPWCEQNRKPQRSITESFEIPGWDQWPTQSPVCGGDDGLPRELDGITFPKWRTESIKAYGNAVVPQVVLQIFKAINLFEKMEY